MRTFLRYSGFLAAAAVILLSSVTAFAQSAPLEIPFVKEWAASPHARTTDEAFMHWNEDGMIPQACSRCHSTAGFQDYIGADGTDEGVDVAHLPGGGIQCVACHNDVTREMDTVVFPSGAEITDLGAEARCMTCHQGRESTVSVNEKIGGGEADAVNDKLGFINIHYRAAGATKYGTDVKGGYEYDGKSYVGYYEHDKDFPGCLDCHATHTVQVKVEICGDCHKKPEIKSKGDLAKIRKSKEDFDGDGKTDTGIAMEVKNLQAKLIAAIQAYGKGKAGTAIVYDSHSYPYYFVDKNDNGKSDPGEAIYPNRYKSWTPRLLRAAYNYQFSLKDPGAYAHNPHYTIQLLYDSIEDLGGDVAGLKRP